jgi:hypothetical protein
MLIGTSLGRCLVSILNGEVDRDDVALIITRTRAPDYERFLAVIRSYFDNGNYGASQAAGYEFTGHEWEEVEGLAHHLWHQGRIHQPRTFRDNGLYLLPEMKHTLWMEVVPTLNSTNESVMQAYEHYQTLRDLTK